MRHTGEMTIWQIHMSLGQQNGQALLKPDIWEKSWFLRIFLVVPVAWADQRVVQLQNCPFARHEATKTGGLFRPGHQSYPPFWQECGQGQNLTHSYRISSLQKPSEELKVALSAIAIGAKKNTRRKYASACNKPWKISITWSENELHFGGEAIFCYDGSVVDRAGWLVKWFFFDNGDVICLYMFVRLNAIQA